MTIKCNLGSWTTIPSHWKCINVYELSLAEQVKGDVDLPERELTDAEIARKLTMIEEPNYFLIVTIPSIVGKDRLL